MSMWKIPTEDLEPLTQDEMLSSTYGDRYRAVVVDSIFSSLLIVRQQHFLMGRQL